MCTESSIFRVNNDFLLLFLFPARPLWRGWIIFRGWGWVSSLMDEASQTSPSFWKHGQNFINAHLNSIQALFGAGFVISIGFVLQMNPVWETNLSSVRWKCLHGTVPSLATTSSAVSPAASAAAPSHLHSLPRLLRLKRKRCLITVTCLGLWWCQRRQCPATQSSCLGEVLWAGFALQKRTQIHASPHQTLSLKVLSFRDGEFLRQARLLDCLLCYTSHLPTAAVLALVTPLLWQQQFLWCHLITPWWVLLLHWEPHGRVRSRLTRDGLRGPPLWKDERECHVEDSSRKRLCLALCFSSLLLDIMVHAAFHEQDAADHQLISL